MVISTLSSDWHFHSNQRLPETFVMVLSAKMQLSVMYIATCHITNHFAVTCSMGRLHAELTELLQTLPRNYELKVIYAIYFVHIWNRWRWAINLVWSDNFLVTWWRHHMETFSALLAPCAGNSPVIGEFPAPRPVTRRLVVFFDLHLNKRLSKQWWGWWFETPYAHYDVIVM